MRTSLVQERTASPMWLYTSDKPLIRNKPLNSCCNFVRLESKQRDVSKQVWQCWRSREIWCPSLFTFSELRLGTLTNFLRFTLGQTTSHEWWIALRFRFSHAAKIIWQFDIGLSQSNKIPFVVFVVIITRSAACLARCPMLARPLLDPPRPILDNRALDRGTYL